MRSLRSSILLYALGCLVSLVSTDAIAAAERSSAAIVLSTDARPLEKLAAEELSSYLHRIYPALGFEIVTSRPATGPMILLDSLDHETPVRLLLSGHEPKSPESFTVTHTDDKGRAIGIIAGADALGTLHAVYALLEELGCGFYLSYEAVPAARDEAFTFDAWHITDAPAMSPRIAFAWHNFLSGCSGWNLPEWRQWITGISKLRFNAIMVHAYGSQPVFSFTLNGQTKPVGYVASTSVGREWATQHVNDVRRLVGGSGLFDGPVFGADVAMAPDAERVEASQGLLRQVFELARNRGLQVYFALDVDTPAANPQNVILTLPEHARFKSQDLWFANPDTPEGYAYYRVQAATLLNDYPQISALVLWFRALNTPLRLIRPDAFPESWQKTYEQLTTARPELAGDPQSPSVFAISRIMAAFRRALDDMGSRQVSLLVGSWGFKHYPACDRLLPADVRLMGLDDFNNLDSEDIQNQVRAVEPDRSTIPIVWAHHDDYSYIGRSFTPYRRFQDLLAGTNSDGFGLIHWTTRPLNLYFKSTCVQVWSRTLNQDLRETCLAMAERTWGRPQREAMGAYLHSWVTTAPIFGRETTPRFIDRPLVKPADAIAGCEERLGLLRQVDRSALDGAGRDWWDYFATLEQFVADFYRSHRALELSAEQVGKGDLAAARASMADCRPEVAIKRFSHLASIGGGNRGEQGLVVSLNLRWLPFILSQRQLLGMEPIRYNFGPTVHDDLAMSPGKDTFFIDLQGHMYKTLGERETGAKAFATPATQNAGAASDEEICHSGIQSDRPVNLRLETFTGKPLLPGAYTLRFILPASADAGSDQPAFTLAVTQGALADEPRHAEPPGRLHELVCRLQIADKKPVQLTLTPTARPIVLCGMLLQSD